MLSSLHDVADAKMFGSFGDGVLFGHAGLIAQKITLGCQIDIQLGASIRGPGSFGVFFHNSSRVSKRVKALAT